MAPNQPARAFSQKDLPPSVETAYYRKCIDLRRRINDIEESNDSTRLRILRLNRGVQKMRLERAFLLEQLNKHMEYNIDDSDRSSSPPPTPTDKPLRSKRSHRKGTPPATGQQGTSNNLQQHQSPGNVHQSILHPINPMSSAQSTPDPSRVAGNYFNTITGATPASPHTNAATGANAGTANGVSALPPLQSLPAFQAQTPRASETPASRPIYDPAYDEQRPAPSAEGDAPDGRPRAYSGAAQQPPPPTASSTTEAAPQNGDTEMTDAGFTSVNR